MVFFNRKLKRENARLKAEIKRLKKGRIPEDVKPKTEEIFRDDEGRAYYRFADPTQMSAERAWESARLMKIVESKLTPEIIGAFMDKIIEAADAGRGSEAMATLHRMKELTNLPPRRELLLQIAAVHYIRSDEDPHSFSHSFAEEKINYWKSRPDILRFFLSTSFREIWNFGKGSQVRTRDILAEIDKTEAEVRKTLTESGISPKLWEKVFPDD